MLAVDRIETEYSDKIFDEPNNYRIRKIKVFDLTDIYLTLLLYFNEDFDDDLLQDALEVLNI